MKDDFQSILENGISFGRGGREKKDDDGKVKTKAKKKKYITGAHRNTSPVLTVAALPCRKPNTVSSGPIAIRANNQVVGDGPSPTT